MYGSPAYQINTATLGLHAEYPLFEARYQRLSIRPVLGYSSNMRYKGDFGQGWRLNYAALLRIDRASQKALLFKGSGQPASFALRSDPPEAPGRYLFQLKGAATPCIEYPDSYTFFDQTQGVWYRFAKDDGDSLPDEIFDAYGNALSLLYSAEQHLTTLRDGAGREIALAYNAQGLCDSLTLTDGRRCAFEYDGQGYLSAIRNFADIPTRFSYENGLLTAIVHGKTPRTTGFAYTTQDKLAQISAVTNPLGGVTRYQRQGDTVRVTTPAGRWRSYTSENGLTTSVANAAGETRFVYQNGRRVAEIDKTGRRWDTEYDAAGHITAQPLPGGGRVRFAYDQDGYRISETGPAGESIRYTNNAQGDPLLVEYPDGASVRYTYTAQGMPETETEANGRVVSNTYDRCGNLLAVRDGLGELAAYRYDASCYQRIAAIDGAGRESRFGFDELGRLIERTLPDGRKEHYRYNCCALLEYRDAAGNRWYTERDAMAHGVKQLDPAGGGSALWLEPDGMPEAELDENTNKTSFTWNEAGFRTRQQAPDGGVIRLEYDAEGRAIAISDEAGNASRMFYTPMGQLQRITTPEGAGESWRYDQYGRPIWHGRASGAEKSYAFDSMSRLQAVNVDGSGVSLTYDRAGNIVRRDTALGAYTAEYDMRSRVVRSAVPDNTGFGYLWNNDDTLAQISYPGGFRTAYAYDTCGRPTGVAFGAGKLELVYDAMDHIIREQCANGVSLSYAYDPCGRMTSMQVKKGEALLYEASWRYDPAGNPLHEEIDVALLTEADLLPAPELRAAYDRDGRLQRLNDITCVSNADGNLIQAGELRCQYDALGRLTRSQRLGPETIYAYGAAAHPAELRRDGETERRYYDNQGRLLYRLGVGQPQSFVWLGGLLAGAVIGDKAYYYHHDQRGNIVLVTDEAGQAVCAYAYQPFGAKKAAAERLPNNPFTFMGAFGVTDEGDELYLTSLRAFSGRLGRFLQPDPLWYADASSRYVYARNNPFRYMDPDGDFGLVTAAAVVGAVMLASKVVSIAKSFTGAASDYKEMNKHKAEIEKKVQQWNDAQSLDELVEAQYQYKKALAKHEQARWASGTTSVLRATQGVAKTVSMAAGMCK